MRLSTYFYEITAGPGGTKGLDGHGWGTLIAPFAFERVVDVTGQALSTYPKKAVVCVWGPEAPNTKIQVEGAPRQLTGVWVKVLETEPS